MAFSPSLGMVNKEELGWRASHDPAEIYHRACTCGGAVGHLSRSVQSRSYSGWPPSVVATGTALSTGAALTVGFIGVVAAICVYDIWLKFNGYKNWDGTPKSWSSIITAIKFDQTFYFRAICCAREARLMTRF